MLVGYDIDGVLAAGFQPPADQNYIVISGRTLDEWNRTVEQIGTKAPIYLRPYGVYGDVVAAGHWKASVIAICGVQIFYEDDVTQAEIIRARCPWCEVRIVKL